jgi:hypothetical protein
MDFKRGVRVGLAQLLMEDGNCQRESLKAFAGPDILEIIASGSIEWVVAFPREPTPAASAAAEPCRLKGKSDLMLPFGDVAIS